MCVKCAGRNKIVFVHIDLVFALVYFQEFNLLATDVIYTHGWLNCKTQPSNRPDKGCVALQIVLSSLVCRRRPAWWHLHLSSLYDVLDRMWYLATSGDDKYNDKDTHKDKHKDKDKNKDRTFEKKVFCIFLCISLDCVAINRGMALHLTPIFHRLYHQFCHRFCHWFYYQFFHRFRHRFWHQFCHQSFINFFHRFFHQVFTNFIST